MFKQNIILFGGSFDPIHLAHVNIASQCAQEKELAKVIFIPAKRSPLKDSKTIANSCHRSNMIKIAIDGHDDFEFSDYELNRTPPSYSIHTVEYFKNLYKESNLFWLAGVDILEDLPKWYRIQDLFSMCSFILTARPSFDFSALKNVADVLGNNIADSIEKNIIEVAPMDISSSAIRNKISCGIDVSEYLNEEVYQYIQAHDLYKI